MTLTRLLLVRHGETVWNADAVYRGRSDIPLSETGKRQAQLTGRSLASEGVTALLSSPLVRARETAEAMAAAIGVAVEIDHALIDLDCGEWEGLTDAQVKQRYPDVRRTWLATPHLVRLPGGETLDEVSGRVLPVLERVLSTPGTAVLVSHRVVHKVAICALLGLDNSHFWDIRVDLTGVTEFDCSARRRVLVRHNDTSHLHASGQSPGRDF
jgi:broad specificity phosphatase PhoE